MQRRRGWFVVALLGSLLVASVLGGCSSETKQKVKEGAKSIQSDISSDVDKASARATAEALRLSLKNNKDADTKGVRSVEVLNQAVKDLPGDPTVTGIVDANGDGMDDDGLLQVDQDGQSACITLPPTGEEIDVTSGACAGTPSS
jgi:hypothetical protein